MAEQQQTQTADRAAPQGPDRRRHQRQDEQDGHRPLVRRYAHPVYGKQVTRTKKVKARNVEGEQGARAGDTVRIMETRPLAKTVSWRVTEVVERAK